MPNQNLLNQGPFHAAIIDLDGTMVDTLGDFVVVLHHTLADLGCHAIEIARVDRAFVELLMLAGEAGLDALTIACELTLEGGVVSAPIVMNALRRLIAPHLPAALIAVPDGIALALEPLANCHRYDYLLESANVH